MSQISIFIDEVYGQGIDVEIGDVKIGGENGATFYPSVSDLGVLSWENDKFLPNPIPVNIAGIVSKIVMSNFTNVSEDWQTITFKINSATYVGVQGMTWYEWCQTDNSYYDKENGLKYECYSKESTVSAEGFLIYPESGNPESAVKGSDVIIPNYAYALD